MKVYVTLELNLKGCTTDVPDSVVLKLAQAFSGMVMDFEEHLRQQNIVDCDVSLHRVVKEVDRESQG